VPENKVVSLEERAKDEQKPFLGAVTEGRSQEAVTGSD
jgi:hypothetical protein